MRHLILPIAAIAFYGAVRGFMDADIMAWIGGSAIVGFCFSEWERLK